RVEAREHPGSAATSGATSDPLAALDQMASDGAAAAPDQDLAFASTLRGDGDGALGAVDRTIDEAAARAGKGEAGKAEPAAMMPALPLRPTAETAAAAAARAKAEAAKAEAAKAEAAKAEAAKAEAAKAEAARAKAETAKAELAKAETAKAELAKAETAKAETARTETAKAELAKAEAAKAAAASPHAPTEVAADAARFTLHLLSFEKRSEADALVGRLRGAGYQPFVVESDEPGKGTMFRVRVGRFASFDEAVAGKTDFEQKQGIIAYVTRTRK
ncbi:MAG TPA: SPOR domain-containing protein, partial [Kofleriaceae bacterium]|nr:SPOR domain-containing protein [Kofleriaceae bacterium]